MRIRKEPPRADIPTASMADIAFLLIVFFMVTTVFSATKGLELRFPSEDQSQPPESEEAVFIKVAADASIMVDCKPMRPAEILDYLEPKLTRNPNKPVILYTDAAAPYRAMVEVYDTLALAKDHRAFEVRNIAVPTQSEVQEYVELFGLNPFEQACE